MLSQLSFRERSRQSPASESGRVAASQHEPGAGSGRSHGKQRLAEVARKSCLAGRAASTVAERIRGEVSV